jgi:hypothetical protein
MKFRLIPVLLVCALAAQQRDFLTGDEVDRVRLTQEPNARLQLYTEFAKLRVELIKQLIAKDKPGRSGMIHQTLEDYIKLVETIDAVTDDALRKNADLTEGSKAVAAVQEELLAALKQIEESEPQDMARYKFSLTNAIEVTEDSLELAREDLAKRKQDANARVAAEKKEREALMTPTVAAERRAADQKRAETEQKQQRKAPTLRRKGEVPTTKK